MNRMIPFALAGALCAAMPVQAHEFKHGELRIEHPSARVILQDRPAAGYMTITNAGAAGDALVGASSPLAERVEMHTHLVEGGVMKMRQVEKVAVAAGGEAAFKPGGHHLMIFGLKKPLKPGDTLPVELTFEKAGAVNLEFMIEGVGGTRPRNGHSGHGGHGKN